MPIYYTKFPCCQGTIYRYGRRRRQCANCQRTWSVWRRKRGCKPLAPKATLVVSYLTRNIPSLRVVACTRGCTPQAIAARLRQSLDHYLVTARRTYLAELNQLAKRRIPLVAVVDALWHHFGQQAWTSYLVLLKPIDQARALIVEPVVLPGHECLAGWQETLHCLPPPIIGLVEGVVCAGGGPLRQALAQYPWVVQRCHFHLLSQLQNYATTGSRSADPAFARYLMRQVQVVLRASSTSLLQQTLANLQGIYQRSTSRGIKRVVRGLFRDLPDLRAYLAYPELNLPTTTNAAESTVQIVRDLLYRARGFRTPTAYSRWITARLYLKQYVTCHGYFPQK